MPHACFGPLTAAELQAYIAAGYRLVGGPYDTQAECLEVCGGTGTGTGTGTNVGPPCGPCTSTLLEYSAQITSTCPELRDCIRLTYTSAWSGAPCAWLSPMFRGQFYVALYYQTGGNFWRLAVLSADGATVYAAWDADTWDCNTDLTLHGGDTAAPPGPCTGFASTATVGTVPCVPPAVYPNFAELCDTAATLAVGTSEFDPTPSANSVLLSSGAATCTSVAGGFLTLTFTSPPSPGPLIATLSNSYGTSNPAQVALVVACGTGTGSGGTGCGCGVTPTSAGAVPTTLNVCVHTVNDAHPEETDCFTFAMTYGGGGSWSGNHGDVTYTLRCVGPSWAVFGSDGVTTEAFVAQCSPFIANAAATAGGISYTFAFKAGSVDDCCNTGTGSGPRVFGSCTGVPASLTWTFTSSDCIAGIPVTLSYFAADDYRGSASVCSGGATLSVRLWYDGTYHVTLGCTPGATVTNDFTSVACSPLSLSGNFSGNLGAVCGIFVFGTWAAN